jgi:GNAT superfamily N-acetyltransferase
VAVSRDQVVEDRFKTLFKRPIKTLGEFSQMLVAESNGVVIGWACLSKWSDRCGYSGAAEISLYVKQEFRDKGIGKRLMEAIISDGKRVGLHTVIGRIAFGIKLFAFQCFEPMLHCCHGISNFSKGLGLRKTFFKRLVVFVTFNGNVGHDMRLLATINVILTEITHVRG